MKHTPTPWHFTEQLENSGKQAFYTVGYTDESGDRRHDICFLPAVSDWQEAHENAKFIELAVNSHNELVAQRDRLRKACALVLKFWQDEPLPKQTPRINETINQLRAALGGAK